MTIKKAPRKRKLRPKPYDPEDPIVDSGDNGDRERALLTPDYMNVLRTIMPPELMAALDRVDRNLAAVRDAAEQRRRECHVLMKQMKDLEEERSELMFEIAKNLHDMTHL